jgi:transglutaminase-like putative cysteine protease
VAHNRFRIAAVRPRYIVENSAPLSAIRITFDDQLLPLRMDMAGVFRLERTSRHEVLGKPSGLARATYQIPLDGRLPDPFNLQRLRLEVLGADAHLLANPMRLKSNMLAPGVGAQDWDASTLNLPLEDPALRALARAAAPPQRPGANSAPTELGALVEFVHGYLRYEPGLPGRPLAEVLAARSGDCTEFADLFTGLARLRGWPARTVIGLAYAEDPDPAFAFHAWNEVNPGSGWQAVDPTWNQVRVDATHMPLPPDNPLSLRLATGRADVRFRVLDYSHFDHDSPP